MMAGAGVAGRYTNVESKGPRVDNRPGLPFRRGLQRDNKIQFTGRPKV